MEIGKNWNFFWLIDIFTYLFIDFCLNVFIFIILFVLHCNMEL
jgi:hypothetical protein